MKKVFRSLVKRPLKNYNVENRAEKLLEKREQLLTKSGSDSQGDVDLSQITAPKHKSSQDHLHRLREEHPEYIEEYKKKNEGLLQRMSGMVVNPEKFGEIRHKPLARPATPVVYDEEFGYKEPSSVPEGKCTIRQAVKFITKHSQDPASYTAAHIAHEHKMQEEQVARVLRHFQTLKVQLKAKDPTRYKAGKGEDITPQVLLNTTMAESKK